MKLNFLGYGASIESESIGISFLLNDEMLVETPPSVSVALNKANMDLSKIKFIYISHCHCDHYWGLPLLLIEMFTRSSLSTVNIYSPRGLKSLLTELLKLAFPPKTYSNIVDSGRVCFYELDSMIDTIAPYSGLSFSTVKVHHGIDTYGLIARDNTTQLFYSADTSYFADLDPVIEDSDIIILDATQLSSSLHGHMTFKEVTQIAAKHPSKTFYPVHRKKYDAFDCENIRIVTDSDHTEVYL